MIDKSLVGRCGLYCGACIIYRAYKDSEELRKKIAEDNNCDIDDVKCEGCQSRPDSKWKKDGMWGENCEVANCLDRRGLTYCYECNDYPECKIFKKWAEIFSRDGVDIESNLEIIKDKDLEKWLKEKKERWTCDNCGEPTSMSLDRCHRCGEELRKN